MEEDIIEKGSDESSLENAKPAKKRGRPAKSATSEASDAPAKRGRKPKVASETLDLGAPAKKRGRKPKTVAEKPQEASPSSHSSDDDSSNYGDSQGEESLFVHSGEDDFAYTGGYSRDDEADSSEIPESFSTSDDDLRHDSYSSEGGDLHEGERQSQITETPPDNFPAEHREDSRDFRNRNRNNQNRQWNQGGNNKMRQGRQQFGNNRNGNNRNQNQQRGPNNNNNRNQNQQRGANNNNNPRHQNQSRNQNNNILPQKKKARWTHLQNRDDDAMNPANLPDWEVLKNEEFLAEYVLAYLGNEEAISRISEREQQKNTQNAQLGTHEFGETFANIEAPENLLEKSEKLVSAAENEEAPAGIETIEESEKKETPANSELAPSEETSPSVAPAPKRAPISLVGDWFVESPEENETVQEDVEKRASSEEYAPAEKIVEKEKLSASEFLKNRDLNFNALYSLDLRELQNFFEEIGVPFRKGQGKGAMFGEFYKYVFEAKKLMKISGVLDIFEDSQGGAVCFESDSYSLKRACVYVPKLLIEKYSLQRGHEIEVLAMPPRENSAENCPLAVKVCSVMGEAPEKAADVVPFTDLTPYYPTRRMIMEADSKCGWDNLSMRVVDLLTPIGLGQRALIVAPPRTGKTVLMQGMAKSIRRNTPDAHVIVLLVDERPEEVTDFQRNVDAEVVASTFDAEAINHVHAAEIVISKARRMVEKGKDVVILLDSITRLARAYNALMPGGGRTMSGGIEASALQKPKKFFGSARNIEGGGSLTIIGTALVETGSKMDEVIFEEFKGTGNLELHLDRSLSDKRIFPSINMEKSGTRKEELLYHTEELPKIYALRRAMKGVAASEAMELLTQRLKKVKTNVEFLMGLNR